MWRFLGEGCGKMLCFVLARLNEVEGREVKGERRDCVRAGEKR